MDIMLITLREFMNNPSTGSTHLNLNIIKAEYNRRYSELIKKSHILKTVYKNKNEYYVVLKIPSESIKDLYYDVVINLSPTEEYSGTNILDYGIKFFSNMPSFTFTFANLFYGYGLLVNFLKDKYPRNVIKEEAIIKNPDQVISYEKSIYFACKYIIDNLYNKDLLDRDAKRFDKKIISDSVKHSDVKIAEHKIKKKKQDAEIKKEKDRIADEENKKIKAKLAEEKKEKSSPSNNNLNRSRIIKPKQKISPKPKITGKKKI